MDDEAPPSKPKNQWGRGNGAGWGGPAKGAGNGNVLTLEGAEKGRKKAREIFAHLNANPAEKAYRALDNQQRAEAMREVLFNIATTPREGGMVRLTAADKLLDRIEGRPVQPVIEQSEGKMEVILRGDDANL